MGGAPAPPLSTTLPLGTCANCCPATLLGTVAPLFSAALSPQHSRAFERRHPGYGVLSCPPVLLIGCQAAIGGKGSVRRKKKAVHKAAAADDKKLQATLKRLGVNNLPSIEEVGWWLHSPREGVGGGPEDWWQDRGGVLLRLTWMGWVSSAAPVRHALTAPGPPHIPVTVRQTCSRRMAPSSTSTTREVRLRLQGVVLLCCVVCPFACPPPCSIPCRPAPPPSTLCGCLRSCSVAMSFDW